LHRELRLQSHRTRYLGCHPDVPAEVHTVTSIDFRLQDMRQQEPHAECLEFVPPTQDEIDEAAAGLCLMRERRDKAMRVNEATSQCAFCGRLAIGRLCKWCELDLNHDESLGASP
jgi:hypothetical protein